MKGPVSWSVTYLCRCAVHSRHCCPPAESPSWAAFAQQVRHALQPAQGDVPGRLLGLKPDTTAADRARTAHEDTAA